MKVADDRVLAALNEAVRNESTAATITSTLRRVIEQLNTSAKLMAWEVVPLNTFAGALPESIRSCWIFVIRPGAQTGAERHPNSHPRSFSLVGSGTFELRTGTTWQPHALNSTERASVKQRPRDPPGLNGRVPRAERRPEHVHGVVRVCGTIGTGWHDPDVLHGPPLEKIALRDGRGLDDLELALLPILPVESARVQKR